MGDTRSPAKKKFRKGDKVRMSALALECNLDGCLDDGSSRVGVVVAVDHKSSGLVTVKRPDKWKPNSYNIVYWEVTERAPLPPKPPERPKKLRSIITVPKMIHFRRQV